MKIPAVDYFTLKLTVAVLEIPPDVAVTVMTTLRPQQEILQRRDGREHCQNLVVPSLP
jgi:hypothetical protein